MHPGLEACRRQAIASLAQTAPGAAAIVAEWDTRNLDNLAALVSRKQSWGEFTRRMRDVAIVSGRALETEGQRIEAGLERMHQAELAQRQAALQSAADAFATVLSAGVTAAAAVADYQNAVRPARPAIMTCQGPYGANQWSGGQYYCNYR